MARFILVMGEEAKRRNLPGVGRWTEDYETFLYDTKSEPWTLLATDRMEPEDVSFYRDLAWVPALLNQINEEN